MKRILLSIVCLAVAWGSAAQGEPSKEGAVNTEKPKKVKITPYGFVRNYLLFDSRNTYTVVGDEYNMIPYDEKWNGTPAECEALGVERVDLNAVPQTSFQALTTRFGLNLEGPSERLPAVRWKAISEVLVRRTRCYVSGWLLSS